MDRNDWIKPISRRVYSPGLLLSESFNATCFLVTVAKESVKPSWKNAGSIIQVFAVDDLAIVEIERKTLSFKKPTFFEVKRTVEPFRLQIDLPPWLDFIDVEIYYATMPLFSDVTVPAATVTTATATTAQKAVNNTAQSLIAANPNRKGLTIVNPHANNSILLGFANTVSATNYWLAIPKASTFSMDAPIYTGEIFALLGGSNTNTTAQVTEFT